MLKIADIIIRIFSGSFLLIAIPGLAYMVREDIKTYRDLKARDLL